MSAQDQRAGYIAGMIDADGHISWRGGKYAAPVVGVTNTSDDLRDWLFRHVGGSIGTEPRVCKVDCARQHIHHRVPLHRWHITGHRAVLLLRAIRPLLIIKGDRADAVIARYFNALQTMERPARRRHHIDKEHAAMVSLGWTASDSEIC